MAFGWKILIPAGLLWVLITAAIIALPERYSDAWTAVIVVILDLSAPRLGAIRTSVEVYDWTLEGFKRGVPIPPPPAPR